MAEKPQDIEDKIFNVINIVFIFSARVIFIMQLHKNSGLHGCVDSHSL
jgi:hypothetical protein